MVGLVSVMTSLLLQLCLMLGQLLTLALLAPFLTDLETMISGLMAGRHGPLPGWRWRQLRMGWGQSRAIPALTWFGLCAVLLASMGIPLATTQIPFHFLSEPLVCGVLLILSCATVWTQALTLAPTRMTELRLKRSLGAAGQDLLFLVPLLALTGTLITVGLPGSATITGLLQQRMLQPSPALLGGLVFIATALLLVLNPRFLSQAWHEELIAGTEGRHRSLLRYRHDLTALCWYLLIADLIWPDAIATNNATTGHMALLWFVAAPARLGVLVILVSSWRALRPLPSSRLALVLSGGAILLVLAGRLTS